ncbi:DUF397 domain-containing protein [Streptomyces sp. NPDC004111]|uniref:DUF397 domain-containing protein n=1 Tax=Streptomyces sp. NPDC004111 TaxID=3364690 RepID=UPI0036B5717A
MSTSPINWQKSSFSGGGGENCVEVGTGAEGVIVMRESDDPESIIATSREKMAAFILGVKAGEFDHFVN